MPITATKRGKLCLEERHGSSGERAATKVATKDQMYALYERRAFGNKLRTWDSIEALRLSGYTGRVTIRYRGEGGGSQFTRYNVRAADVPASIREFARAGANPERFNFNEAAPDECLLFQGEVMRSIEHITLRISDEKTNMRSAMTNTARVRHLYGLEAIRKLRSALTPSSYSDLRALWELYPTAVIELSVYEMPVGDFKGRNAVVWEVRDY
jgi:hypothetical protein